jgi:predicted patatin/cPLA2 family phospholipase
LADGKVKTNCYTFFMKEPNGIPTSPVRPESAQPSAENLLSQERAFHQERWGRRSKEILRGWLRKKKSSDEIMIEEALRDDKDFEKRKHREYIEWQKNLQVVLHNMVERAKNPEGSNRKVLVVILGGGMKCAYSGGQVIALNMLGLTADKVDAVVGASGGAVVATAYVAGTKQTLKTTEMMATTMSSKEFIDPTLKNLIDRKIIKLDKLRERIEDEESPYLIDVTKVQESPTKLSYVVTLPVEGSEEPEVRFLDAKKVPSIPEAITASMTLPNLTGAIPKINGVEYRDGAISPLPIDELIREFDPTDVLILPQAPFEELENIKPSTQDRVAAMVARVTNQRSLEKGLLSRKVLRKSLERTKAITNVNIGVMWAPDGGMDTLDTVPDNFKAAVVASVKDTLKQFGQEQAFDIGQVFP